MDKKRIVSSPGSYSKWNSLSGVWNIQGLVHRSRDVQDAFKGKSEGTILLLKREPNNPYDINAIAIYSALNMSEDVYKNSSGYEWTKVGYVPRGIAENNFIGLDENTIIEATKFGSGSFRLSGKTRQYQ